MNLLNKFTNIDVNNSERVPQDVQDKLDLYYKDYQEMIAHNYQNLKMVENFEKFDNSKNMFDSYLLSRRDTIDEIKTKIRNLKHTILSRYFTIFNSEFNLGIDYSKVEYMGKKFGDLYTNRHYENKYGNYTTKCFTWEEIESIDPSPDFIIDIIFTLTGSKSLEQALEDNSKDIFKKLFLDDKSVRTNLISYKNGMISFKYLLVNPTSNYNDKRNIDNLKSFLTILKIWCKNNGGLFNNDYTLNFLRDRYGIGSYGLKGQEQMFQKLIVGGELIDSIQYYQNGSFKVKFKNKIISDSFLSYCEI